MIPNKNGKPYTKRQLLGMKIANIFVRIFDPIGYAIRKAEYDAIVKAAKKDMERFK